MKKQIKRITAFAAAVAMAAAFTFPAEIGDSFFGFGNVIVASAESSGEWVYTVNAYQTVTITVYQGSGGAVEIPAVIDGKSVTSIGNGAFKNCPGLESITIPYTVTSIGDYAFERCTRLKRITIPDGVTSIGTNAFNGCSGLTDITVDSNNPYYCSESGVLFNKNKTTLICYPAGKTDSSYTIPDGVTSIGYAAFEECTGLTSIYIPDGVTSIGDYAFERCTGLESITIPDSVNSIGYEAFNRCTKLTSIYIPDGISIGFGAIPSTAARITYIVNSDGSVTITKIEPLGMIDIPAAINGKKVIAVEEGYRSYIGNHTCASSTPATCINTAACGICGQDYYGDHNISHHDAAAHTCTADGTIEYWECSVCGKYFSDADGTTEITNIVDPNDPARHLLVKTDAKASTCTDDGNRAYWTCTECGNIFSDESGINQTTLADVTIYATGHSLTHHDAVAHTCTTDGNIEYWDCSVCTKNFSDADGKKEIDNIVDPAPGHNWDTAYESNETHHWHNCTNANCPITEDDQKDGYAVHTPGAAATETTPQTCTECGYVLAPALGHIHANHLTFVAEVPASCTTDGVKAHYVCECGMLFSDADDTVYVTAEDLKIAAHHTYGTDWESDNDEDHYHACSECGDRTDVTAHTPGAAATETTPQTCTECGYVLAPALGHIHANHLTFVAEVPASCTTDGVKAHYVCECGMLFSDTDDTVYVTAEDLKIAAHHTPGADWVSDNDEDHYHICSVCSDKTDVTHHSYDSGMITTPATETTEGVKTYTCSVCNHTKTEAVSKLGHTHSLSKDYSKDKTGHWHACSGCDEKVDFGAHIENSGTVTVQPTETSTGVMTYYCSVCGYEMRTETIPVIQPEHTHNYGMEWKSDSVSHWHECSCGDKTDIAQHISNGGTVTVQPTAYSTGLRTYSCTVCDYVLRTETIPATGSNYHPTYPTYPTYPVISTPSVFTEKLTAKAESDGSTATLSWDNVENADKYYVYQYKDGKYVKVKTTTDTSVTLNGLKNGETYKFLVRYSIDGKLSPMTYSYKQTIKVYYKPIVKATSTENSIKLTWRAVPNAEKYAIYRYVDGKAVKLAETTKLSVIIKGLKPDTECKYIVSAYVDGEWTSMKKFDIVTIKTKAE